MHAHTSPSSSARKYQGPVIFHHRPIPKKKLKLRMREHREIALVEGTAEGEFVVFGKREGTVKGVVQDSMTHYPPPTIIPSSSYSPHAHPFDIFTAYGLGPLDQDPDIVWVLEGDGRYRAYRLSTSRCDPSVRPRLVTPGGAEEAARRAREWLGVLRGRGERRGVAPVAVMVPREEVRSGKERFNDAAVAARGSGSYLLPGPTATAQHLDPRRGRQQQERPPPAPAVVRQLLPPTGSNPVPARQHLDPRLRRHTTTASENPCSPTTTTATTTTSSTPTQNPPQPAASLLLQAQKPSADVYVSSEEPIHPPFTPNLNASNAAAISPHAYLQTQSALIAHSYTTIATPHQPPTIVLNDGDVVWRAIPTPRVYPM
ncbi:MAG: hypothetical protein Q9219_002685 [cf. Caloplaca sp. 3 TL-2023]